METYWIRKSGRPEKLELTAGLPEEGFLWVDFVRDESPEWTRELEAATGERIFEAHVSDSLNLAHPSFFDATDDYEMLILRGLATDEEAELFRTRPTAYFLFERMVVTVRPPDSVAARKVKERFASRTAKIPRRPAELLHYFLNHSIDRFLALREPLMNEIQDWQERLLDPRDPFNDWTRLMARKSHLRRLEVLCEEQEDAIQAWREGTRTEFDDHLSVRFPDLLEHIRRVLSHSQHMQHEIEALVQINFSATAHRTNEVVKVLTVVSAIFLPLTLISGIFGMNFEYMPELKLRYAYFVALGGMTLLGVGMFAAFKRRGWF